MLTPAEQLVVQAALEVHIAADGNARQFITLTFKLRGAQMLRDLPTNFTTVQQHAGFVLGECLTARWPAPPDPSLLELLLSALIDAGGDIALIPLRDRVKQGEAADPNPDPVKTLWVNDNMPFLSRQRLRPIVTTFLNRDVQPILRIIGPADAGKSYTRWLIHHVSRQRFDQRVLLAEVAEGAGPSYTVEELIDTLLQTVPHPNAPPRAQSNFPAAVARWIVNTVTNSPGRSILVLDGFNQADLLAETKEVIRNLAQQVGGANDVRKRVRLVLIDYEDTLPAVHLANILLDTVPDPATITPADVEACLAAHYNDLTTRGKPKTVAAGELTKTANTILSDAISGGLLNLETLNTSLTALRLNDLA